MCALTPMFPSKQQEWYSPSTMEYPCLSQAYDSLLSPTLHLPSFLYPSNESKNNNINLHHHHDISLSHNNGTNTNSNNGLQEDQETVMEKKLSHNASERHRRRKLNALYSSLSALLPPSYHKRKLSIPMTVSGVVKYIPEQRQELQVLSKRKEDLLKRISRKTSTLYHHKEHIMRNRSIDSSSQNIAANWITDTEIAVQVATSSSTSISDMLLRLELKGFNLISLSSSVSSTTRIFYTLHLQMRQECRVRLEELNDMLL
ncbi:unnamed protein product [Cochlearia groenlandica]